MKDLLKEEWEKIKKEKSNSENGKVGNLSKEEVNPELKELLKQEGREQEIENLKEGEINWLEGDFFDNWDKIKGHWHNIVEPNSKKEFPMDKSPKIDKWFFLAHSNDEIEGKPQLVHDVMQRIPLVRLTSKINKEGFGKDKVEWKTPKYIFFDER